MYKIFVRPCGDTSAPTQEAYEVLNSDTINNTPVHTVFDASVQDITKYVQSPTLELSATEAGTCTFTVLYGHPFYSKIQPYKSEILVYEYDTCIWIGRVIDIDKDTMLSLKVTAEGALAALNDIYTEGKNQSSDVPRAWFLSDIFEVYIEPYLTADTAPNVKRTNMMAIKLNYDYLDPSHELALYFEDGFDYCSIKEVLDQIVTKYGGYFFMEPKAIPGSPNTICPYLRYSLETPSKLISTQLACTFTAKIESNIKDLSQDLNIDGFATAIRPLGARIEDENPQQGDIAIARYDAMYCTEVPTGVSRITKYFYIPAIVQEYGWIEKSIVYEDIGPTEDDSSVVRIGNELAVEAAKDLQLCLMQVVGTTVKFNAFIDSEPTPRDISGTVPSVPRLFDGVKVISPIHGVNITTPIQILDLSVDMMNPYESEISLSVTNYKRITKLVK